MVSELMFTDDEIRSQLEAIGLEDVTGAQLRLFRQDLERLIQEEDEARKISTLLRGRPVADDAVFALDDVVSSSHKQCSNDSGSSTRSHVRIEKAQLKRNADSLSLHNDVCSLRPISQNDQSTDSSAMSQPRTRKVLRHIDGKKIVCDESVSQNGDSDGAVANSNIVPDYDEPRRPISRMKSTNVVPCLRRSKSVILPRIQKPVSKSLKSDPVALYHYYKREWERHKAPGEKDHSELRWNIRRAMMMTAAAGPRATSAAANL